MNADGLNETENPDNKLENMTQEIQDFPKDATKDVDLSDIPPPTKENFSFSGVEKEVEKKTVDETGKPDETEGSKSPEKSDEDGTHNGETGPEIQNTEGVANSSPDGLAPEINGNQDEDVKENKGHGFLDVLGPNSAGVIHLDGTKSDEVKPPDNPDGDDGTDEVKPMPKPTDDGVDPSLDRGLVIGESEDSPKSGGNDFGTVRKESGEVVRGGYEHVHTPNPEQNEDEAKLLKEGEEPTHPNVEPPKMNEMTPDEIEKQKEDEEKENAKSNFSIDWASIYQSQRGR